MIPGRDRERTLQGRIMAVAVVVTSLVALGAAVIFAVSHHMRTQLDRATESFVQEQRIADRISQGVVRQLVAASSGVPRGNRAFWDAFAEEGDEVQAEIQRFLFRSLTADERLQLQEVKSQHEELEVAAARATALQSTGDTEAAAEALEEMYEYADSLLSSLGDFLSLRERDLEQLHAEQDTVFTYLFLTTGLLAIGLLVGSLMVGRFLHHQVARPLSQLSTAAGRIEAGDLDARVELPEDRDLRVVAESFNRMARSLSATQTRLEQRNRELLEALERERSTQAELVQAEKMSAVGRMTAGLAHELNNPLATILGYAELLDAEVREGSHDGVPAEYLEPLLQETRRARSLVRNLLRFARKSEGDFGPVSLRNALDVVVGLRQYAFDQAGLELVLGPVPDVSVHAERQRLQDAFLNIVNNALEAMIEAEVEGGTLRIHATDHGHEVLICFDDDGPGIEEPDQVFEPFFTTKPVGAGTGLGLALVHRFVEECGGEVVAGTAPGGGARFEVVLRRSVTPPEDPGVDETVATSSSAAPPEPPARVEGNGESPRVLVVEDEEHILTLQARLLRKMGADPVLVTSAARAREALEEHAVDLVISDVRMPDETGVELYRWLQEHRPALSERFVFVTGDLHNPETVELARAHPELFIQKPFELAEYMTRIGELLGRGAGPPEDG